MKKQSGFTLIELLLVLAIIGIISAIAIPALLSQRARARDKAAMENMVGTMSDMIGTWDKAKEAGSSAAACRTAMGTVLTTANNNNKNPWNTAANAYVATVNNASPTTTTLGQVEYGITASNLLVGRVVLQNQVAGSTGSAGQYIYKKVSNLE